MRIFSYIVFLAMLVWNAPKSVAQSGSFASIEFVENKGQWDEEVLFRGEAGNGFVFLTRSGFTILQYNEEDFANVQNFIHYGHGHEHNGTSTAARKKPDPNQSLRYHVYNVNFKGTEKIILRQVRAEKPLQGTVNYMKGTDSSKWGMSCRAFQSVQYDNVFDKVDIRFYSEGGQLKYDFIVHPGGDVNKIRLDYDGVDKISIKKNQLLLRTSVGEVTELYPFTYQSGKQTAGREEILCKYVLKGKEVHFEVDDYDKNATLIIDPTLVFSTYSGSRVQNWGFTATHGPDGSFYGGGIVFGGGSLDFPVLPGAYQTQNAGGEVDIGIIKLNAAGRNRIYATYIGGSGYEQPHSLFVDADDNLVIAGRTNSGNFPLNDPVNDTIGRNGGWDIILMKLNATGTAAIGTKRIGGAGMDGVNVTDSRDGASSTLQNYGDDARSEVIIDRSGNILLAASTQSRDFPTTNGVFAPSLFGEQDAVVMKFNSNLSTLIFSTHLGGAGNDAAFVLAENPLDGNIYVAGATESDNIAGRLTNVFQTRDSGNVDGFVAVITPNGSSLERFSYFGTGQTDLIYGIQFDKFGFPYIMGITRGSWPIVGNPGFVQQGGRQFVSKLRPDLSGYVFSTVFGSTQGVGVGRWNISPTAFLVDRCENMYVSGWGGTNFTNGFPGMAGTAGLSVTSDAYQRTTDNNDFYFIVIQRNASAQLYGTFFGQNGGVSEHVDGGTSRFDARGNIYQAICANCSENDNANSTPFPGTAGSWSPTNPSGRCSLGMLKITFNYTGVVAQPQVFINGRRDSIGCVPAEVEFRDMARNAVSYEWNFGDGSPDVTTSDFSVTHTYDNVGAYRVRLIAIDPNTCNERDTAFINVYVRDDEAVLDMNVEKLEPCEQFNYRFDNLTVAPPNKPFGPESFAWDFGDGTPIIPTSSASVTHSYASPGSYDVKLILLDTGYCNAGDTLSLQLRVNDNVVARFQTPATGCAPYDAVFTNNSLAGQTFSWDFGDGQTSNEFSPVHRYEQPGTYTVRLVVEDPNTCNLRDETSFTISIAQKPVADFSYQPVEPVENTPVDFFNNSSNDAIRFKWLFGDGDSLITNSRNEPVSHQYNRSGTFDVSLIAYNQTGCTDTMTIPVEAIVVIQVDVPSAFTPQGDARNNKVFVAGFGISNMRFRIYNRWGQLMFESNSQKSGWDGTYKGALQPMDVYAYTLEVEFFDGTRRTKKGDITLIR